MSTVTRLSPFGIDINASSGRASADETREAIGAFLLMQAGYPTEMKCVESVKDEVYLFKYKGNVWRFQFIIAYDVQLRRKSAFRIHFDHIRRDTSAGQTETSVDDTDHLQRRPLCGVGDATDT